MVDGLQFGPLVLMFPLLQLAYTLPLLPLVELTYLPEPCDIEPVLPLHEAPEPDQERVVDEQFDGGGVQFPDWKAHVPLLHA